MAPIDGLRVSRSAIHGYGLFATRQHRAGHTVCDGDGVILDSGADDTYALAVGGGPTPCLFDLVDQTRWINHSCEPNLRLEAAVDAGYGTVAARWVALRDIAPGDELLYDYAYSAPFAAPCRCGAPSCRGLIVDCAELPLVAEPLRRFLRTQAFCAM